MNVCIVVAGDSYAYSGSYATYVRTGQFWTDTSTTYRTTTITFSTTTTIAT